MAHDRFNQEMHFGWGNIGSSSPYLACSGLGEQPLQLDV
jgi:hypothetical protein